MCQGCDCRVGDVIFKRGGLQVRLDSPVSQLLGVCCSFTTGCERLEHYRGHSAVNQLQLKSLLASPVSCFVGKMAHLVRDEVADNQARLTDVIALDSDSMELY